MAGKAGNTGRLGVPIIFPRKGAGPVYVVPVGWVTFPDTTPPLTTIFPFTSIFPPNLALDPTESIVPVRSGTLDEAILPVTVLPLANVIVPLLKTFPVTVTVPMVFTRLRLPMEPPVTLDPEPSWTA